VHREDPAACSSCGKAELRQDEDILDTWFSSALWPFSTLGWPEKTRSLQAFYPNATLVTGPDIIFFWVARMMMMGVHFTGKTPFRTVYLTAIVTDENGDKMSKTKGNVIDPLDVVYGATLEQMLARADAENAPDSAIKGIKKHFAKGVPAMGADALRFSLAALNTSGRYIRLSIDRVEGYRNFINKLWNASRFALMNMSGYDPERFDAAMATPAGREALGMPERWIMSRLQHCATEVDAALEAFRFSDAANAIYHFVWYELCDWYIELAKPHLHQSPDETPDAARAARRQLVQGVLATVLEQTLRLLHPFAPFVTEEIWQQLPKPVQLPASLMITIYPRRDEAWVDAHAEQQMKLVQDVAVACRMLRATYNVSPAQRLAVEIRTLSPMAADVLARFQGALDHSAKVTSTLLAKDAPGTAVGAGSMAVRAVVGADAEVVMPLVGVVDPSTEKARLVKEIAKAGKDIEGLEKKLGNAEFIAKAPEDVIAEQRARLADDQAREQRLRDALAALG
jgi:valyl-tRNA synthetase